ncbi:MAG: DUF4143 domain-containing protein [Fusobacteriaceae bacterium]|jgi:predicted AAA+ superfamily ATPase|nr:DUF4143 domain-containing protein [Fusobacteriaceae bacterium]
MALTKKGYKARIIDAKIEEYLQIFGAISIEGPKWCGKTWTSLNHANSATYIMNPAGNYQTKNRAMHDPTLILNDAIPQLIDEWQEVPGIWDAVRYDIDLNPGHGKYILTGSVTPPRQGFLHSGVGRFAFLHMYPMTLSESGDSECMISFSSLFEKPDIKSFVADIDLQRLTGIIVRGGWPEALALPEGKAGYIANEYIKAIYKNELFNEDFSKRNSGKLELLLRSLARNNVTTVNDETIIKDIEGSGNTTENEEDRLISRSSVLTYIKDLKKIFMIEDIPAWGPEIRSKTRIRTSPKRIFADPSLAVAVLGINVERLLSDFNTLGFMFENLCLRDIAVYAGAMGGSLYHYRDNSNLEVDAVVELKDGTWAAFEIKLGEHSADAAAKSLIRLRDKMTERGARPPAFLSVITGGGLGMKREDGVYVVPINALRE